MKKVFCDLCLREVYPTTRVNLQGLSYVGDIKGKDVAFPVYVSFKYGEGQDLCIECFGTGLADLGAGIVHSVTEGTVTVADLKAS